MYERSSTRHHARRARVAFACALGLGAWGALAGVASAQADGGAVLRLDAPDLPAQLAVEGDRLWSSGLRLRLRDPQSGAAAGPSVATPSNNLLFDGRRAWLTVDTQNGLVALDPAGADLRGPETIAVGSPIRALAATRGGLWVQTAASLRRHDPAAGVAATHVVPDASVARYLAASERRLWSVRALRGGDPSAPGLPFVVEERDPATGTVTRTTGLVGSIGRGLGALRPMVATPGAAWLVDAQGRLYRVPEGGEARLVGLGYRTVATDGRALWALTTDGRTVRRLDPDTGRARCEVNGVGASGPDLAPAPLAVARTRVWTASTDAQAPELIGIRASACAPSQVALSAAQLRINQRISQGAVRRVNALAAERDGRPAPGAPSSGAPGDITLSAAQLRINQRISQAAVRRVNALQAELDGRPAPAPEAGAGGVSVALSATQLRINQRISQAAILRVTALQARVSTGLVR